MLASVFSGKKKIMQNGQTIFFDSKQVCTLAHVNRYTADFLFPWSIGRHALRIVQLDQKFELQIDNQSFTHLWDNGKGLPI